MKSNIKKIMKLSRILLILLAFTFSSNVSATTSASTSSTALVAGKWWKSKKKKNKKKRRVQRPCKPGDKIPLDGGLSFLVLGAAAFGVKKLRDKRNDKS